MEKTSYLFLLLLFAGSQAVTTELCKQYFCNDFMYFYPAQMVNSNYTYCAVSQELIRTLPTGNNEKWNILTIKDCPMRNNMRQICPIDELTNLGMMTLCREPAADVPVTTNLLPGNNCTQDTNCQSGSCANGVCQGLGESSRCNSNAECNVGFYCQSRRCRDLVGISGACEQDTDCVQNSFCYQNQCRAWLTLDDGAEAPNNEAKTCVHASIDSGRCAAPLKRNQTETGTNVAGKKVCNYTDSEGYHTKVQENSICGYSQVPAAYCPLGHGDEQYIVVLNQAKNLINAAPTLCHTDEALSCPNLKKQMPREVMAWENLLTWPKIYPLLENTPSCVKYSVNYEYEYLYTGQYPEAS